MIVEGISKRIATYLHENTEDKEKFTYNKMYYGLQITINFCLVLGLLSITSAFLGIFYQSMLVFVMVAILRQVSGGLHLKSSELCTIVSTLSILVLIKLSYIFSPSYLDYISIILMLVCAPATFKVQPSKRKLAYFIMKSMSVVIVLINLLILKNSSVSLVFMIQALSVLIEHYKFKKRGASVQ